MQAETTDQVQSDDNIKIISNEDDLEVAESRFKRSRDYNRRHYDRRHYNQRRHYPVYRRQVQPVYVGEFKNFVSLNFQLVMNR